MAAAVAVCVVLYLLLPDGVHLGTAVNIAYPVVMVALLVVLVSGDPGRIDREAGWIRLATGILVSLITIAAAVSGGRLVAAILTGYEFGSAQIVLGIAVAVWLTTVIAFALWYWHLDGGGPVARAVGSLRGVPAFCFPEQSLDGPEFVGWYPQFVDYLALSFSTATTFGPTDVSAVRQWSKLCLMAESGLSLALVGLVFAQAVGAL